MNQFFWFYIRIKSIWKKESKTPVVSPAFKSATEYLFPVNLSVKVVLYIYHQFPRFEKHSPESSKTFGLLVKKLSPLLLHDFIYFLLYKHLVYKQLGIGMYFVKQFLKRWHFFGVWIAHLVSRFACNTRVIVDVSLNPPVSNVKSLNKNFVTIHQLKKQTLHHQSITQMVIR